MTNVGSQIKIGDLVRHRNSGAIGTIIDMRKNRWDMVEPLVMVHWPENNQVQTCPGTCQDRKEVRIEVLGQTTGRQVV